MTHVLHLVEDTTQAAAVEAAFREFAPNVQVTTCGTPMQLRERFAAAHPRHGVVVDDRVAGGALSPLVRHLRAEDPTVPIILVTDLEGEAAVARRALAGVDEVVPREAAVATLPTLLSEIRAAGDPTPPRVVALVAGAGAVLPPVLAGCKRTDFTSVALDAGGTAADAEWSRADALVLVSSSTGEQAGVALQRFRRLHPTLPVIVVAEERFREGFLRLDAFDCVPPSTPTDRLEETLERAARLRRILLENVQLRSRETRLRAIVENLPDGVVLTTAEGAVLAANAAALSLLDLRTASQIVGHPLTRFLSIGEDGALPTLAAGDSPVTLQFEAREADGRRLVAHVAPHLRDETTVVLLMVLRAQGADPAAAGTSAADTAGSREPEEQAGPNPRTEELQRQLEAARDARAQAEQTSERLQRESMQARDLLEREQQAWLERNRRHDDDRGRLVAELEDARARLAEMTAQGAVLAQSSASTSSRPPSGESSSEALASAGDVPATSVAGTADQDVFEIPGAMPDDTRWAFEAAGIGTAETTASGEILACSDAAARLCGYPDASELGAGRRLPDALLASGGLAVASSGSHRFEVCFQTPDGLLHWVLGSARWHQPAPSVPPVLQWLLVDRSEHHRSVLRARFVSHMESVTRLLPAAAADCAAVVQELAAPADAHSAVRPASAQAGDAPSVHAALQRVQAVLDQLARFAQNRARRPVVLPVNAALVSLAPMLSWLAGEDRRCDIDGAADELRINADPADLEELLAKMVMAGRDCLPAGGTLTFRAGTARVDGLEGGVPLHRPEAALTLTAQGYGCEPIVVPAALTDTVARLGGRLVATHEAGGAARLSVLLVPVLGLGSDLESRLFHTWHCAATRRDSPGPTLLR